MKLLFGESGFDAVVVLSGSIPTSDIFVQLADVPIIAADGAANLLIGQNTIPEFIVGDLDSITPECMKEVHGLSEFVHDTNQDTTDFEKSLLFAREQLWTRILVCGIHGGDLEHTLNNWSVLMRYSASMVLTVLDGLRYAIPVTASMSADFAKNEIISLIPQPQAHLTTTGLVWNLNKELLAMGEREGARNRVSEGHVSIDLHSGSLLLTFNSRFPRAPIFAPE